MLYKTVLYSVVCIDLLFISVNVDFQLVPSSAVFKYIANFDDMSRPYCILALVHLAEVFGTKLRYGKS